MRGQQRKRDSGSNLSFSRYDMQLKTGEQEGSDIRSRTRALRLDSYLVMAAHQAVWGFAGPRYLLYLRPLPIFRCVEKVPSGVFFFFGLLFCPIRQAPRKNTLLRIVGHALPVDYCLLFSTVDRGMEIGSCWQKASRLPSGTTHASDHWQFAPNASERWLPTISEMGRRVRVS